MIATLKKFYSVEEYRTIEAQATERSEYRHGEIIPRPGGSLNHSRIGRNILIYLASLLRGSNFEPINSDLRLWIPEHQRGLYPDVMVFEGEPQLQENRTDEVLNPVLIVEVLSPSTADYDRENKFRIYRSIPSFREYLLVAQDEVFIESYSKQPRGWLLRDFNSLGQSIPLESLGLELAIAEIYHGISF